MKEEAENLEKKSLKDKVLDIKENIYQNPKKFYVYSMFVLVAFFLFSLWRDFYYPPNYYSSMEIPSIQTKSEQEIDVLKEKEKNKENESKEILSELKELRTKKESGQMTKEDSVRAEFLMNKYNELNNGGF